VRTRILFLTEANQPPGLRACHRVGNGHVSVCRMPSKNIAGTAQPSIKTLLNSTSMRRQFRVPLQIRTRIKKQIYDVIRSIMEWGGVNNEHRQKGTIAWLQKNSASLSTKIVEAIAAIKDDSNDLRTFDGSNFIMNSAVTKIVSLADPEQNLIIYDSRVGGALAYFVVRYIEQKGLSSRDVPTSILFATGTQSGRRPKSEFARFPILFGKGKDQMHALMVRSASRLVRMVSRTCSATPREIEAALFMWGYKVE
jgi:hypothetical protein